MRDIYVISCVLLVFFAASIAQAQPVVINKYSKIVNVNSGIEILEDANHTISPENAFKSNQFKPLPAGTPNENISSSAFWFRFKIRNETNLPQLILKLANPAIDSIDYYEQLDADLIRSYSTGQSMPFSHREYLSSDFLFTVHLQPYTEKYIYFRVSTTGALLLPLETGTETAVFYSDKYKDIFWGMYIGLMLAMLLYNCFIYSTTKDNSYLYYIFYLITVFLTQITISGYAFQLLWPNHSLYAKYSIFFNPVLAGVTAIVFIRHFLKTKTFVPFIHKGFIVFAVLYVSGGLLGCSGNYKAGLSTIDMTAGLIAIYVLITGIAVSLKKYRPAVFFLIAWIVFMAGVFIFVFKNFNILPYNNFTIYTMPVGSAMEVLLLSFALADRINTLKKEVEASQVKEMLALLENERIVYEQNLMLEARVNERTIELKLSNDGLNKAMEDLKNTEAQLIESEKMAALGQLTAGMAHEINNPINFVTSHIQPLDRDVQMLLDAVDELEKIMQEETTTAEKQGKADSYKKSIDFDYLREEISQLLHGIGEGASRTAEIVNGLRIFSRLDEGDLKKADINEGLDATLIIANHLFVHNIKVKKKYGNIPLPECYPGQVNQAFLNIIINAVSAIKEKFGEAEGGLVTITTGCNEDSVIITIADNGIGMDEHTSRHIFEPFFTTRKVGEGTGLGLSVVFNIIARHNGHIEVHSRSGIGSIFTISIPMVHTLAESPIAEVPY